MPEIILSSHIGRGRPVADPPLPHHEYERLANELREVGVQIDATQVAWIVLEAARLQRERQRRTR